MSYSAWVSLNWPRPHLSAASRLGTRAPVRSPLLPSDRLDVGRQRRRVGLLPTPSVSSSYKRPDRRSFSPPPFHHVSPRWGEPPWPLTTGKLSHRVAISRFLAPRLVPWLCASFALGVIVGVLFLHPPWRITRLPTARHWCESFPSPLVTGAVLLHLPHARAVLVRLENQARGISSSSSHLSASTPRAAAVPSFALVRSPFPASPTRFSCSSK
jgi:hypothetical protein